VANFQYFRRMISRWLSVAGWCCAFFAFGFIIPEGKPTLIVFTGSDWCNNCRYLEKTVLNDSAFVRFTTENTELIIADFPQKNKLPAADVRRNDSLAALYNSDGTFPKIVLLKNERRIQIPFHRQNASALMAEIRKHLP